MLHVKHIMHPNEQELSRMNKARKQKFHCKWIPHWRKKPVP